MVKIQLVADFTCPFSYMGKRRLDQALEQWGGEADVELVSFQLTPEASTEQSVATVDLLAKKFGKTREETLATTANLRAQAEAMGLEYNYETMRAPNTKKAHRLTKWAAEQGKGYEATEAFFHAVFTAGKDLNVEEDLLAVVESIGLNPNEAKELLATEQFATAVDTDKQQAIENGIRSVPVFIIENQYIVTGVQDIDVFVQAFEKANH